MKSKIFYRIPGQEITERTGYLTPIDTHEQANGFVVSNFLGTKLYGFTEKQVLSKTSAFQPFCISKEDYFVQATCFVNELKSKEIDKAVLSRIKKVEDVNTSPLELFHKLCSSYPATFCYYLECEYLGTWLGATPEKLIEVKNEIGSTMALAGTKQVDDLTSWGAKEIYEQKLVKEYIEKAIAGYSEIAHISDRKELMAGPVKHLVNYFSFIPFNSSISELIRNLHPTPAVSGFPKNMALQLLEATEKHERSIYAGIIGIADSESINLFVNLRCCQFIGSTAYLYIGGGFTQESIPENEWQETENKAKTLINLFN